MRSTVLALAILAGLVAGPAAASPGAPGHTHSHDGYAFGEPGDPKKPARVVEVVAREVDGRMAFEPSRIEVKQGERIRFRIRNAGQLAHEFMLGTPADNAKHAALMQRFPEMEHDDPNGTSLQPGATAELVWTFSKAGTFEFACLKPGHYEAGMNGPLVVVPASSKKK
ncbi:cupredoxin domain-containing protein [Prosthecomicrobium sp. N25]|uniref:cupredoxin domain-containing protein n=1 Tax=Prosthecomicrobium sp. N25 TaxID=3129254 RepID=UPI003077CD42